MYIVCSLVVYVYISVYLYISIIRYLNINVCITIMFIVNSGAVLIEGRQGYGLQHNTKLTGCSIML